MKREEFIKNLLKVYSLVSVLSDKNECLVMRVRNKKSQRDMVVRSFSKTISAYDELYKIKCDNLPEIYDTINLEDGMIVFEEFIEGINISEVMQSGKYRYLGAKKIVKAICNALSVLHERDMVHRDIKPENVMIDKNGRVVLIDFNASRKISNAEKDTVIMGTVGYVSPEQLGITQSDKRTDIYALGILLNVMLTGKHPSECLAKGKAGRIIRKCTNLNPDERFQSVERLANSL